MQRDFGAGVSDSLKSALDVCRRAVRSHSIKDATALWGRLRVIAAELRPRAGTLALRALVDRVRSRVALADYPDHAGDWATLDARSSRDAILVPNSLDGRIQITRDAKVDDLAGTIAKNQLVALLGASGAGKSAVARALFELRRARGERTLWLDALSLDCGDFGMFESALHVNFPLENLLGTSTAPDPVLILDGLDRLYSRRHFEMRRCW